MLNHVFLGLKGILLLRFDIWNVLIHRPYLPKVSLLYFLFNRPHDRVPLKDMKADWHACLDNPVGFKVRCKFWLQQADFFFWKICKPMLLVSRVLQCQKKNKKKL